MENLSKEKQIESTDWLTRGMTKEEVEREKQQAIMSVDLEMCHTEFVTGVGDIYTDYDETARKMFEKGYSKQSEGKWVKVRNHRECSECGYNAPYKKIKSGYHLQDLAKHCPNCGAKMKGGEADA